MLWHTDGKKTYKMKIIESIDTDKDLMFKSINKKIKKLNKLIIMCEFYEPDGEFKTYSHCFTMKLINDNIVLFDNMQGDYPVIEKPFFKEAFQFVTNMRIAVIVSSISTPLDKEKFANLLIGKDPNLVVRHHQKNATSYTKKTKLNKRKYSHVRQTSNSGEYLICIAKNIEEVKVYICNARYYIEIIRSYSYLN